MGSGSLLSRWGFVHYYLHLVNLKSNAVCCSTYHNNFVVQAGERTYYGGVPQYLQIGEHQFVEDRVVRLWINQMLVAW